MLQGRRALVLGVANARSIAWAVADRWRKEGADVFVTYQNERFRKPVEKLVADSWGPFDASSAIPAAACDVAKEHEIATLWETLRERGFCSEKPMSPASEPGTAAGTDGGDREGGVYAPRKGKVDAVLHSMAHAPSEAMRQGFTMGTTLDAFTSAHVVSAYSLVSVTRHALPFLAPGASITALTYIGSSRVPLERNAEADEISGVATFLASPLASSVTGQTVYADCGFSAVL